MRRTKRIDAVIQVDKDKIHIKFDIITPDIYGTNIYAGTYYIIMFVEQSDNYDNKILEILSLCRDSGVYGIYLDCDCKLSNTILETIKKFNKCNKIYIQYSSRFIALN